MCVNCSLYEVTYQQKRMKDSVKKFISKGIAFLIQVCYTCAYVSIILKKAKAFHYAFEKQIQLY